MNREHTPSPGTRWATTIVRAEHVIPDDCPHPEPAPNRETRRAVARQQRRKGRR